MSWTNKNFSPGETPPYAMRRGEFREQNFYICTGVITHVDLDKYQMTIKYNTKRKGLKDRIPISFAYAGPAGCMGSLPEKGAVGIFGFYDEGDGKPSPLLLGFLPSGLDAGLNFDTVKILPDPMVTSDINEIQFKFRKLTVDDMVMTSPAGSMIFLNKNIELKDSIQDSIIIREEDQSIMSTSLHNFVFTDGVSITAGPALRNKLTLYDSKGNRIPNNGSPLTLSQGKENIYIVPHGAPLTSDTQYYSEYRVDVDEYGNGKLDLNDINSSSALSDKETLITLVMGNYIGSDLGNDPQKYGSPLKVQLFKSANDKLGAFALEKAVQNNGIDEPAVLGLAYALHSVKSSAFIGLDKEGHYYMNLPASVKNPLGAGRSMSIAAQGNLKESWGLTKDNGNSWDLGTVGGIKWSVGSHNENLRNRSIDIRADRGVYFEVKAADGGGFAKTEKLSGNVSETVSGDKTESIGNVTYQIRGAKTENIGGSYSEVVGGVKSLVVSGDQYSETVIKEKLSTIGVKKTTITSGNHELTLLLGSISETIVAFGKRSTTLAAGGTISNFITSGSITNTVGAGEYSINVNAGTIGINTPAGFVTVSGSTVKVKGSLYVSIDAPIVRIGNGAPIGGVLSGLPGIPSHFDYCTGLPLKGSMKVSIA